MTHSIRIHDDVLSRIRAEFSEMPDLRLTVDEAARFWQLDVGLCRALLVRLAEQHVLKRTRDGAFARASS